MCVYAEDYTEGCGLETNYLRPMAQYVLWKFAGYRISRSVHNRGRGTECIFFRSLPPPLFKNKFTNRRRCKYIRRRLRLHYFIAGVIPSPANTYFLSRKHPCMLEKNPFV